MTEKDIANAHKVLSDKTRWEINEYLKSHNDVSTNDLIKEFRLDASTLSFHLAKLKKVDLITITKDGKNKIYNSNKKTLGEIYNFMGWMVYRARENHICTGFTPKELLNTFELYSDASRLKILNLIIDHPACTGKQIKLWTNESEANISFHIKKLVEGNVIYSRRKDNQHYYWPNIQFLACFHGFMKQMKNKNILEENKKCSCGCK